ncbi:MAG: hypothetical protein ACP5H2_03560 [Solirubrobacteraceae bacterium]
MGFPIAVTGLVAVTLAADTLRVKAREMIARRRQRKLLAGAADQEGGTADPGRELRAERAARALLHSCVGEEDWEMYRALGFMRVWARRPHHGRGGVEHAYLVYPHEPIVCYEPQTGRLLGEYCVTFPDTSAPHGSGRLPDSDDVLAKWMALVGDERQLLDNANMHLPGRYTDVKRVRHDIWRLTRWEQQRAAHALADLRVSSRKSPS